MSETSLNTPLKDVLDAKEARELERSLEISTVRELLDYAPRRYIMRGDLTPLDELPVGEDVTVIARVEKVQERRMQARRGSILDVTITDGPGAISLTWFNQPWRAKELKHGDRGLFAGKVTIYNGRKQLAHPDYKLFTEHGRGGTEDAEEWADTPVPVYAATQKIKSWRIGELVEKVLDSFETLADPLPEEVRHELSPEKPILQLKDAYEAVHRPKTRNRWASGKKSLKYREALQIQLALEIRKQQQKSLQTTAWPLKSDGFLARFDSLLPFTLTGDQRRVGEEIAGELQSATPMHRLLQGEVGSGKTLVALRAMLQVADHGGQAVLLAPTEVLAGQHIRSITDFLGPDLAQKLKPTLLTGQLSTAEKRVALLDIASGDAKIVVGTHALMSDSTKFFDLGLVVVDEQHRFGVEQRETLRQKGKKPPHTLVMTATPIPRTIALTAFGDLDVSTLQELPAGRVKITTHMVPTIEHPSWLDRAWERAAEEIAAGRQVYVVCPTIAPGESLRLASVLETLDLVRGHTKLGQYASAPLTGELSTDEKDQTMRDFAAGKIDLLVATTVIEVGVNVPNASLMIILDADRFGVSQLHQLRGRVGRGEHPGMALFVTDSEPGSLSRERLEAVAGTLDGFELAQVDLEQRSEGDVLGQAQSGTKSSLVWLRVTKDKTALERARKFAQKIVAKDPLLETLPGMRAIMFEVLTSEEIKHISKS